MIDWRTLPPLSALRAFSAFASSATLEQAGSRIGVTHAAVSQQLRVLEAHLGLQLVERGGRSLMLTVEGRRLADALESSFGQIANVIGELTERAATRPLRITAAPAFAASWLLPRLSAFHARYPDIDLTIDPSPVRRALGTEADVGFRFGAGDWPGVDARLILRSPLVVVAAPALVTKGVTPSITDLTSMPWLQEFGTSEVADFFARKGILWRQSANVDSLPGNLMLEAARDGQGVTIIARSFVEADIAAGRLQLLHEDTESEGYYLVCSPGSQRPAVSRFCKWVLEQAGVA